MQILFELEPGARAPFKFHPCDAGWDLFLPSPLYPGRGLCFDTGVHVLIPAGFVGLVQPRSSISAQGLHVATGVIDAGYTGSIKVTVWDNDGARPQSLKGGERIAQLVVVPLAGLSMEPGRVIELHTDRGAAGFGSTGK